MASPIAQLNGFVHCSSPCTEVVDGLVYYTKLDAANQTHYGCMAVTPSTMIPSWKNCLV